MYEQERIAMLRLMLEQAEKLERELAAVNENIKTFEREFWRSKGYTVIPRRERLKEALNN